MVICRANCSRDKMTRMIPTVRVASQSPLWLSVRCSDLRNRILSVHPGVRCSLLYPYRPQGASHTQSGTSADIYRSTRDTLTTHRTKLSFPSAYVRLISAL